MSHVALFSRLALLAGAAVALPQLLGCLDYGGDTGHVSGSGSEGKKDRIGGWAISLQTADKSLLQNFISHHEFGQIGEPLPRLNQLQEDSKAADGNGAGHVYNFFRSRIGEMPSSARAITAKCRKR